MDSETTKWIEEKVIYQAFVGRWEIANFHDHPGEVLRRLAALDWQSFFSEGFSAVYLLGLFDNRGPIIVEGEDDQHLSPGPDRVPSVFALSDHTAINPSLGSNEDFSSLVDTIHTAGGKVIVDFVPNHTGLAHPWLTDHPDYYITNDDGDPVREFSGDVAKLDYSNPKLCTAMTEVLVQLAEYGIDGLRCDMAHLVPDSFWHSAIERIRERHPHVVFIAEAYPETVFDWGVAERLVKAGFNLIYHEALYRNITQVYRHGAPPSYITDHIAYVKNSPLAPHLLHYLSNHDDPIPDGAERDAEVLWKQMMTLPGSLLVYNGSLLGFTRRLHHHTFDLLPKTQTELVTPLPNWWREI